jgi:hypothetical protein
LLPLSSDIWIGEASFERLAPGRYIARVKVITAEDSRIDMFALPPGYEPSSDKGRSAADALRDYYLEVE